MPLKDCFWCSDSTLNPLKSSSIPISLASLRLGTNKTIVLNPSVYTCMTSSMLTVPTRIETATTTIKKIKLKIKESLL